MLCDKLYSLLLIKFIAKQNVFCIYSTNTVSKIVETHIDGLVQDCSTSIASALDLHETIDM